LEAKVLAAMAMPNSWNKSCSIPMILRVSWVLVAAAVAAGAQEFMPAAGPGNEVRLINSDAAVLEAREVRKDLPCTATSVKPSLGFDLKFHAGYAVTIPLKELAGSENLLTIVFRVTPTDRPGPPVYFSQHISVPSIAEGAGGPAYLEGSFDVGEGKYHVDWLMRDRAERVCSDNWDIEASLPSKDKDMALDINRDAVRTADAEPFKQEPPVEREARKEPLNVKVVVNFAPQESGAATLQPLDLNALVSILRNIARDPRITRFSIVAFNMQEQRVIYRQESASQIDFPALGNALKSLNLGTVDLKRLSQKHGDSEFLGGLITKELTEDKQPPDAVIFAGPKVMLDGALPDETLRQLADVKTPVFYMNYNLNPQVNPWRDAIGNAVKAARGSEFTISRPRDLFFSWTEIISRIVKSKFNRTSGATAASQ
jgi:hypothetical protein